MSSITEAIASSPDFRIDVNDPRFSLPVAMVDERLHSVGTQRYFDLANSAETDPSSGMQFKLVGSSQVEHDSAILMPGTFANGVWPHMVARASAVAYMAHEAGLRGWHGEPVPVLLTGAPGMKSSFGLSHKERRAIAHGEAAPLGERYNRLLERLGITTLFGTINTSQAAISARAQAVDYSKNFDMAGGVVIVEPPHAKRTTLAELAGGMASEGKTFKSELKAENIRVINELFESGKTTPGFALGVLRRGRENLALAKAFTRGQLKGDLFALGSHQLKTTVIHGSNSKIADPEAVFRAVEQANWDGLQVDNFVDIHRVEIVNANHSFGDRVGRFAVLAAGGLTR